MPSSRRAFSHRRGQPRDRPSSRAVPRWIAVHTSRSFGAGNPADLEFLAPRDEILVDLAPDIDIAAGLREARGQGGRIGISTALTRWLPARLADAVALECGLQGARLADQGNEMLQRVGARVNRWGLRPVGSEGWRTAEVTLGGVDTRGLDSRSLVARTVPGLYFIGEVVDVTGWLGGYNFQWAWASAHAAGRDIAAARR